MLAGSPPTYPHVNVLSCASAGSRMAYCACMMDDDVEEIYDDGCFFLFCVANA